MEVSQLTLAALLLLSCAAGISMAAVYDIRWAVWATLLSSGDLFGAELTECAKRITLFLRVREAVRYPCRIVPIKRHSSDKCVVFLHFWGEFGFGIQLAVVIILILYGLNKGQLRLSAIAAALVGVIVYRAVLRSWLGCVLQCTALIPICLLRWFFALLLYLPRLFFNCVWARACKRLYAKVKRVCSAYRNHKKAELVAEEKPAQNVIKTNTDDTIFRRGGTYGVKTKAQ